MRELLENSIGPDYVKINYSVGSHAHVQTLSFRAAEGGEIGDPPSVLTKSGGTQSLSEAVNDLVAEYVNLFNSTVTFGDWSYYHLDTPTSTPRWIASGTCAPMTGGSSGTVVPGSQYNVSFHSAFGGRFNFRLMETAQPITVDLSGATFASSAATTGLNTMLTGGDAWVCARDGFYLSSAIRVRTKQNDKLRNKYR